MPCQTTVWDVVAEIVGGIGLLFLLSIFLVFLLLASGGDHQ